MSSSALSTIQSQLNLYGYPIFMTLGNIGNVFIVILFSRQRQNTCSIYLISSAIANDLYLTFNSLVEIFPFYYRDETLRAFTLCKIRFYLSNVLGQIAKTMLVLACMDRFMFTSTQATLRAFHRSKRAKWLIVCSTGFWPIFASHIAIMTTIVNKQCGTFGVYGIIYSIYTIIFVGLIPPVILGVFGFITYRNMKLVQVRVRPIVRNITPANISMRRRDRKLLVMIISEVFVLLQQLFIH